MLQSFLPVTSQISSEFKALSKFSLLQFVSTSRTIGQAMDKNFEKAKSKWTRLNRCKDLDNSMIVRFMLFWGFIVHCCMLNFSK